jgi:hypothetical protein
MADLTTKGVTKSDIGFLKMVGVATMLIDHVGYLFFYEDITPRIIGRMAFPIFAYCLVVGFVNTGSVKKYLGRLILTGLVSQPIYVWAMGVPWNSPNILLTFAVSLVALEFLNKKSWIGYLATLCAAFCLNVDFGLNGVVLISIFYLVRNSRYPGWIAAGYLLSSFFFDLTVALNQVVHLHDLGAPLKYNFNAFGVLAIPLIYMKEKPKGKPWLGPWFYYAFYPVHLAVLRLGKMILQAIGS